MIYIISFIVLVAVIGIVTAKINAKPHCNHDWQEEGSVLKCSKCAKSIPNNYGSFTEAA